LKVDKAAKPFRAVPRMHYYLLSFTRQPGVWRQRAKCAKGVKLKFRRVA